MVHIFEPIILRYEGFVTEHNIIELGQLGQSIQGAARLLGSAGNLVETGHYVKKTPALAVRVLAGEPRAGSYELPAVIMSTLPAAAPLLPIIQDFAKSSATKAVTGIVNYAIARLSGRKNEAQMAIDLAEKALTEMGHTSRTAIEAIERVALSQRPAVKLFISPVGESCATAKIGEIGNGAIAIDKTMRDAIEAPDIIEIGSTSRFEILLSELDLKNKSCKFSLRDDDDPEHRTNGEITDPILLAPNNPYSAALDGQKWLAVVGKPQLKEGEIERLYIADLADPK
jgi:hypothetical protein